MPEDLIAAVTFPDFSNIQDLGSFISQVYAFALGIVGVMIFVRILWAGFQYLTAAGSTAKLAGAKDGLANALIGALILFSAYLILYVINPDLVCNTFNFGSLNPATPSITKCQ